MPALVNTAQSEAWNGDEGRHWSDHQDRWNAINSGFNDPLLAAAALGPADRVLDIGCGTGQTTRLAAGQAASALGFDLSGPMLTTARQLAAAEGTANVSFQQGDAQVHPFAEGSADVVLSRFGVMFFSDPAAAFANIARALRPRGRIAFVCMAAPDTCEWVRLYATVANTLRAGAPEPSAFTPGSGMFSLSDPATVHRVLTPAGFTTVATTEIAAPGMFGASPAEAADLLLASGPGRHLAELHGPEATHAAMRTALEPYATAAGIRLTTTALLVTAEKAS